MDKLPLSGFMSTSKAEAIPLPASHAVPICLARSDLAGAFVDLAGPAGALILASGCEGHAIRFGSRADILALALHLLALHEALALRDRTGADAASADLDRIIAERATVTGYGRG